MKRNVEKGNIVTEREERLCERIRKIERKKTEKFQFGISIDNS